MSDIGQIIVDQIKEHFGVDVSIDSMDEYRYLYIHATIPADTNLGFFSMNEWTSNYFI
jgi:hypothetical protein